MIKNIVTKNKLIILILLMAAFLRLYRLYDFSMFLADQGRDALIILRILRLEHFPAIGAPSSVGDVYLGPFYYYLITPFLLLTQFNPVGLAIGVSLLSILGLSLAYFIIKHEIDNKTAVIFLILASFSFVNIELSRFSWNPNLLPIFSFLTLYFFYQLIVVKKMWLAIFFGAFLSFSIQLHYLALFIFAPILIIFLKEWLNKSLSIDFFDKLIVTIVTFLFFTSPLIIFDIRHDFLNTHNLVRLFTEKNVVAGGSFISRFLKTNQALINHVFQLNLHYLIGLVIILLITTLYFLIPKKNKSSLFIGLNFLNLISFLLIFSILNSERHPHYYGVVYYSFFLAVAYILTSLSRRSVFYTITLIFLSLYSVLNIKQCYFLYGKTSGQIDHARKIANFLAPKINGKLFNFATYPTEYTSEDTYLYFLELNHLKAANRKNLEVSDQMFVLCNKEPCRIVESDSWNISMFGKAKIDKIWTIEGIKIFKLVHAR